MDSGYMVVAQNIVYDVDLLAEANTNTTEQVQQKTLATDQLYKRRSSSRRSV